jgi:hypothetical protein
MRAQLWFVTAARCEDINCHWLRLDCWEKNAKCSPRLMWVPPCRKRLSAEPVAQLD